MTAKRARFLIKDDGYVYPFTEALAKRNDMRLFVGTLEEARKDALRPRPSIDDEPKEQPPKEPVAAIIAEEGQTLDFSRMDAIKAAIAELDKENTEHYTGGGIPRVQAIEQVIGDDITAEERDQALTELAEEE